jgi:hypothetical protein
MPPSNHTGLLASVAGSGTRNLSLRRFCRIHKKSECVAVRALQLGNELGAALVRPTSQYGHALSLRAHCAERPIMAKEQEIVLVDVMNGHATFETKGLYRVVYHGDVRRDIYVVKELMTAEEAIQYAEIHNSAHTDYPFSEFPKMWAEAVSYDCWEERQERCEAEQIRRDRCKDAKEKAEDKAARKTHKLKKQLKKLKAKAK